MSDAEHEGAQVPTGELSEEEIEQLEEEELSGPTIEEIARQEDDDLDEMERAHGRYMLAVLDHFGPEAPIAPCPTCKARGFLDFAVQSDPGTKRCEACHGLGITLTGSLVEANAQHACTVCNGAGFVRNQPVTVDTPFGPERPIEILSEEQFTPYDPPPAPVVDQVA